MTLTAVALLTLASAWTATAGLVSRGSTLSTRSSFESNGDNNNEPPVVDLGYNLHRADTSADDGEFYYTFSNIRYATANRFARATYPPPSDRSRVYNGSQQSVCPQAYPAWQFSAVSFLDGADLRNATTEQLLDPSILPPVAYTDEDCLHLDVQVPKAVFDKRKAGAKSRLLPILVYIHGGGYVQGHKSGDGGGEGLIARAIGLGTDGVMYVALNYRLGMFGWLSSPDDHIANLGLHDQLTALRWVRDHARLFGGDPSRITVLSQSAGAGSAAIHLTSTLARGRAVPFQQAILQSPYMSLLPSQATQAATYQRILDVADAGSVDELRKLDTRKLQDVNYALVARSAYGAFTFGPVIDPDTFPAPLPSLLASISRQIRHKSRNRVSFPLIVSTNSKEGLLFAAPNAVNTSTYLSSLSSLLPLYPRSRLADLTATLYPASSYPGALSRLNSTLADLLIRCTARGLLTTFASSPRAYSYQYSVPSGVHAADLHYTFFSGDVDDLPQKNATVAHVFQSYIAGFAALGGGSAPASDRTGVPALQPFGEKGMGVDLNVTGIAAKVATWLNKEICDGLGEMLGGEYA
ncbi:Alpha/Beta hydrolase protein [Xylariaceae sp. FL0594]|nr:Alpha/Beta hydrolase protein [Xylariaceae sp. FL0594]